MSRRINGRRLDLKLNVSPPARCRTGQRFISSPSRSPSESSPRSCVSFDDQDSSSPEVTSMMMLVGCPRCLMYVMVSEIHPKCPKCHSTDLLEFLNNGSNKGGAGSGSEAAGCRNNRRNNL